MKMSQFVSITLVIILGMFLNTCGQMLSKDEGMSSKSIEEASGTTDTTDTTKPWTKQLGTSGNDQAWGVATDSSDNVYVTGFTNNGLDGHTNNSCPPSCGAGNADIFLVKYNSSGTKQ